VAQILVRKELTFCSMRKNKTFPAGCGLSSTRSRIQLLSQLECAPDMDLDWFEMNARQQEDGEVNIRNESDW
jgi:hypothetical protein